LRGEGSLSDDLTPEQQNALRTESNRFRNWMMPEIPDGRPTKFGWIVRHPEKLRLSPNTDIGAFTYIQALNGVTIEEGVQIGSHVSIYTVSSVSDKLGPVILRRNCKVGTHAVIMPGVTVGENSVVGVYCYITEDVPSNTRVFRRQELEVDRNGSV
jgi:acetyltransferase-like isoleucine patch superfamily enzyme